MRVSARGNQSQEEYLLAIVKELVQFPRRGEHHLPRLDEFAEICPGVVEVVLPLGDEGGVVVTGHNKSVGNIVSARDALLPDGERLFRKLFKPRERRAEWEERRGV